MSFQYPQTPEVDDIWTDPIGEDWQWNGRMWHRIIIEAPAQIYEYTKITDVLAVPETYTAVASLTTTWCRSGTYEVKIALTYHLDTASKLVYFRWREDEGTWHESIAEPRTQIVPVMALYLYPVEHPGGVKLIEVEMKKEDATGILNIDFLDIVWDQKK